MPFCTECGARHDDAAKICPTCGQPIAQPPSDDDDELDDVLASLDELTTEAVTGTAPSRGQPSPDYVEQIQEVRGAIAAQSTALQELNELTWENPTATEIRDELTVALAQLRELTPPHELSVAHEDFVQGADHLVHGFVSLVDAINQPGADEAVDQAQEEIAQATDRFRRGADQLNDYLAAHDAAMSIAPEDFPNIDDEDDELDLPADEKAEEAEIDPDALLEPTSEAPSAAGPAEIDLDELEAELQPTDDEDASEDDEDEEIPPLPDDLAALEDLPEPVAPSAMPSFGAPSMPAPETPVSVGDAPAGAWPTLGDAATDSLLLEIEGGWVRGRPGVYEAIERSIRGAVADALRAAYSTRVRVEEEARANLQRLAGERNRLLDEVEALRRDTLQLQSEAAEMRRTLNELERERQAAQDRRQHMFQEAESHRAQLLGEIEQLGGQLDAMRQNIVSLLNMSVPSTSELAARPAVESPAPADTSPPPA